VTAALMRRPYERRQGKVVSYRNGHGVRQISCGVGVIEVPVPRVSVSILLEIVGVILLYHCYGSLASYFAGC